MAVYKASMINPTKLNPMPKGQLKNIENSINNAVTKREKEIYTRVGFHFNSLYIYIAGASPGIVKRVPHLKINVFI